MKVISTDKIYADNNATTPCDPRVVEAMEPYFKEEFGNPSSLHSHGRRAREAVEEAREKIAFLLNAKSSEIVFTSSASESNNFALKEIAFANRNRGKHIITSQIEHKSVLEPLKWLEKQGFEVTYLPVDKEGFVSLESLKNSIRKDTILVSIMLANNEVGTIEPIKEIDELLKDKEIYFHTDAAQAPGKLGIDVKDLGVDLLTINGHKMYAPKGIGALWIKQGVKLDPLIHGGGQEEGSRSATENVPYIVGFGKAAEIAKKELGQDRERLIEMQKKLIEEIPKRIEGIKINGPLDLDKRLPGNTNFSFKGVEGESLVLRLDDKGIETSTGSACAVKELAASHVLKAMGISGEMAHSSLRISLGKFNIDEDVEKIITVLPQEVGKLRAISAMGKVEKCF